MSHLIYDPEELSKARVIAVCVPGALSSIDIFEPTARWREAGYGLAYYPFPGLDGRAVTPKLNIADAADEIARLAAAYPDKPIRLLGYSTGGPIVISAAAQMHGDVKIAAMAPAVDGGGGPRTGVSGFWDICKAAGRARSLRYREIWMEYYRVLLFGRAVERDTTLAKAADALIAAHQAQVVFPDAGKPRAHTDDLRHWRAPKHVSFQTGALRFFVGLADPVFSLAQTRALARKLGSVPITGYPEHGHLLFLSHKPVFKDIFNFFEGVPPEGEGIDVTEGALVAPSGAGNSD